MSEIQLLSQRNYVIELAQYIAVNARKKPRMRIWFERRTGEHERKDHGDRVISLQDLMFAYASMFGSSGPHADLTPSALRQAVRRHHLLDEGHDKEFYFLSAILLIWAREAVRARRLFSRKREWPEFGAKSQMLYALRLLVDKKVKSAVPAERSGKSAQAYLARVRNIVLDQQTMQSLGQKAVAVVDDAETSTTDKDGKKLQGTLSSLARLEPFTRRVEALCVGTSV